MLAEVYMWVDNNGRKHFSDKKPAENEAPQAVEKIEVKQHYHVDEVALKRKRDLYNYLEQVDKPSAEDKNADDRKRKQQQACGKVKRKIAKDKMGGVYYSFNKAGEKVIWSHKKRKTYSRSLLKKKKRFCD